MLIENKIMSQKKLKTDKNKVNKRFIEFEMFSKKSRSYQIFAIQYSYNLSS